MKSKVNTAGLSPEAKRCLQCQREGQTTENDCPYCIHYLGYAELQYARGKKPKEQKR